MALLDFCFEDPASREDVKAQVQLVNVHRQEVFYDKLSFTFLQMPNFRKSLDELNSPEEEWLYLLRHLSELEEIPARLAEYLFKKVFRIAELAQLSQEDRQAYEDSLKYYRDLKNSLDTAFEEGKTEGRMEGEQIGLQKGEYRKARQTAEKCLQKGMSIEETAELTGLSIEEVRQIA